jgi:hypothetical protein
LTWTEFATYLAHPVAKVHDLRWALGSGTRIDCAHHPDETQPPDAVRQSLATALTAAFDIEHATLQVDASTVKVNACVEDSPALQQANIKIVDFRLGHGLH